MSGAIPSAFQYLRSVDLSGNRLSGEIPSALASYNLEYLDLSGNELSGEIPLALGNVPRDLRHLDLRGNNLSGEIHPAMGNHSELRGLFLSGNRLTGEIPSELGGLTNMVWLQLDGNQLSGPIPPELGALSDLLWLHISGNRLVGEIPAALGSLDNLKRLRLGGGNRLTGCVPDGLRDVPAGDLGALGLRFCGAADPAQGDVDTQADDRAVLAALYDAMDGASWREQGQLVERGAIGRMARRHDRRCGSGHSPGPPP